MDSTFRLHDSYLKNGFLSRANITCLVDIKYEVLSFINLITLLICTLPYQGHFYFSEAQEGATNHTDRLYLVSECMKCWLVPAGIRLAVIIQFRLPQSQAKYYQKYRKNYYTINLIIAVCRVDLSSKA